MTTIEASTVINRPVGEVFAFATDIGHLAEWAGPVTEAKQTSDGPVGVGATQARITQLLGRRMESNYEVTEYQPNSRYSAKTTSGPIPLVENFSFEAVEGGTKVTVGGDFDAHGVFKLAEPIVNGIVKRQMENDMGTLKDLLEAQT